MIAQMNKQEFDSLCDIALFNACFKPLILEYKNRMTKDNHSIVQELFYNELNTGQKSLFVFHVYYDHAIESTEEFYWWSAYYLAQPKIWSAIKRALTYLGDEHMYQLLTDTEFMFNKHNYPSTLAQFTVTRENLRNNEELAVAINSLYDSFNNRAPQTVKYISDFIRNNHTIFVKFKD